MMKLFTVGPVEMYPEILEIGSHQIPYFRNQYFSDIMYELDSNLKKLMNMARISYLLHPEQGLWKRL